MVHKFNLNPTVRMTALYYRCARYAFSANICELGLYVWDVIAPRRNHAVASGWIWQAKHIVHSLLGSSRRTDYSLTRCLPLPLFGFVALLRGLFQKSVTYNFIRKIHLVVESPQCYVGLTGSEKSMIISSHIIHMILPWGIGAERMDIISLLGSLLQHHFAHAPQGLMFFISSDTVVRDFARSGLMQWTRWCLAPSSSHPLASYYDRSCQITYSVLIHREQSTSCYTICRFLNIRMWDVMHNGVGIGVD